MIRDNETNNITIGDMMKMKKILNAEKACANSTTDWSKNFWYNVFRKLCVKYNRTSYFEQKRGD